MEARIIRLGPSHNISSVSTFDEAFGEYSEASGKRQAKKADKRAGKKAKKLSKAADKLEVRTARKTGRVAARAAGQTARISKRATAQASRQTNKDNAKTSRLRRKAMSQPEEELEEEILDTNEEVSDEPQNGYTQEENASEEEWGGGEPSYEEEEGGPSEEEEESFYNEAEESGFDGSVDDRFNELSDASQIIDLPEPLTIVADKIEWNNELYSRFDAKKTEVLKKNPNADIDELETAMIDRGNRIEDLESILYGYGEGLGDFNNDGDYESFPNLDKDYSEASGKNSAAKNKRKSQVAKAKMLAKEKRAKVTMVNKNLNPNISNNRIEIDADSNFSGTGLNGLDLQNDFDAPDATKIELKSNVSGPVSSIKPINVIIGIGLAAAIIYAIKKYKLLK